MDETTNSAWFSGVSSGKRIGLLLGLVLILALLAAGSWWLMRPSYAVLVDQLDDKQQADVLSALVEWQVPYRIDTTSGQITVPTEQIDSLRGRLATSGITSHKVKGFELFDSADYGMSEFTQRINYQRALEGELARSIMSLPDVRFARVHLTLQKASLFANNRITPKASVIVHLKSNASFSAAQISGVQQLVASAVEGMGADAVSIIDDRGRTLNSASDGLAAPDRNSWQSGFEQELEERARRLVETATGITDAAVSVRVQANFDRVHAVRDEVLLGPGQNGGVVVHKKEHRADLTVNNPADAESDAGNAKKASPASTQSETEYAYGKEHSDIERAVGRVERISIGIVLTSPVTGTSSTELQEVLAVGLGLEASRGDRLVVTIAHPVIASAAPGVAPVKDGVTVDAAKWDTHEPVPVSGAPGLWVWLLLAAAVVVVLLLLLGLLRRQPEPQRRLSDVERNQMLQELRQWLNDESVTEGGQ